MWWLIRLMFKILWYLILFMGVLSLGAFVKLVLSFFNYQQPEVDISKIKKGDLVLTGTNKNIESSFIKISNILTNGMDAKFWTHVAVHIGDGKLIEALPKGIGYSSIEEYLKKGEILKVFRHKHIKDDVALDRVIAFCEKVKEEGCSYGWVGLSFYVLASFLPVSLNFIFDNKLIDRLCNLDKAYFCSELAADAYKEAGHRVTPYDSWRMKTFRHS